MGPLEREKSTLCQQDYRPNRGVRLNALDLYSTLTVLTRGKSSAVAKGPARIKMSGPHFLDIDIFVILVSKQFATFFAYF
jgi:hypothetical protein